MSKAEIIIAITNTIIAVVALALSLWTGWVTRKHNRLSVYPFPKLPWLADRKI